MICDTGADPNEDDLAAIMMVINLNRLAENKLEYKVTRENVEQRVDERKFEGIIHDISRDFDLLSAPTTYNNATPDEQYFHTICHDKICTDYHYSKMAEQIATNQFIGFPNSLRKYFLRESKDTTKQRMIFHKYAIRDYIYFSSNNFLPPRDYTGEEIIILGFIVVKFYYDAEDNIIVRDRRKKHVDYINSYNLQHSEYTHIHTEVKNRMREGLVLRNGRTTRSVKTTNFH